MSENLSQPPSQPSCQPMKRYFVEVEATTETFETNDFKMADRWFSECYLSCAMYRNGVLIAEKYLEIDDEDCIHTRIEYYGPTKQTSQ